MVFPEGSPPGQRDAIARLARVLSESRAARVGETAVVSTQVHIQDIAHPGVVAAILESDAGQVFYHRDRAGEVLHIDVFHSPGQIDPRSVARSVISVLSGLRFEVGQTGTTCSMQALLSYIDVQTGAGGGRLDGPLTYGREAGVRRAHLSHVHVTALTTPEMVAAVFSMVAAVEAAIEAEGLELRKIWKVRVESGTSPVDVSNYLASTDSLLRQMPRTDHGTNSPFLREALARQAARDAGSAGDAMDILQRLEAGLKAGEFSRLKLGADKTPEEVRQALTRSGLMRYDGQRYTLSEEGAMALSYLKEHSREIEAYLRRMLWSLPKKTVPQGERKGTRSEPSENRGRGLALPRGEGGTCSSLALPETVAQRGARANFLPSDLRFCQARSRKGSPVILLIDASASMAGRRMRAAKELAKHLVLAGKDKVSIVAFQDSDVKVVCPFTKSAKKVEAGLKEVQAMGLTPLARGLEKAMELSMRCLRKPLILCVTDGIPTVPSTSLSPIDDAISAARALGRHGIRLGCIGLEPNQGFLRQMVSAARGTLYVVEELEASTLAAIARKETS